MENTNCPLVSVVIPNYNHAPYLRERIESVLRQDYPNFEVLILDDCSTDESRDIINEYADAPHVKDIVLNDKNTGNTFVQWDKGIRMVQGEYVWIAESDDVAEPQFLSSLVTQLNRHPDAMIAFAHSRLIDANGNTLAELREGDKEEITIHDGKDFCDRHMLIGNAIYNASMYVFRRKAYENVEAQFINYRYCGDWFFAIDLCVQGKVIEVNRLLNNFRQHPNKVTTRAHTNTEHWIGEIATTAELIKRLNMPPIKAMGLRGRLRKRIRKGPIHENIRNDIARQWPELLRPNLKEAICYIIGKHLLGYYHKEIHLLAIDTVNQAR